MPRQVDHDQRRLDIIRTTKRLIDEGGLGAVSFREIGKRMGGSTTLVTHYYATQQELLLDISVVTVEEWRVELGEIEADYPDALERLHQILFEWLLPVTGQGLTDERTRINFVAANIQGSTDTAAVLDTWEEGVRECLRGALRELVSPADVEHFTDMLRVTFNGLCLSAVEHPDRWPAEKQEAVMRSVVEGLGLDAPRPRRRRPRSQ